MKGRIKRYYIDSQGKATVDIEWDLDERQWAKLQEVMKIIETDDPGVAMNWLMKGMINDYKNKQN